MKCAFLQFLLRLKEQIGVAADKDAAALLGLSSKALTARKRRNSIPDTELYALSAKRPDLNLDVQYILTGERTPKTHHHEVTTP